MTTRFILAGWLIDGSGGPNQKAVLLTIEDGLIAAIGPLDRHNLPDPARVTDLSFATIAPPFIDCHVHLAFSGTIDQQARKQQIGATYAEALPVIKRHIGYLFRHGVLAVRDAGDAEGHVLRYKAESLLDPEEPLILKAAGRAWHQRGRYGRMIGRCPEENDSLERAFLHETEQSDLVKLVNSGVNSLREFARETRPQFSVEEMRQVVAQAKKVGKKVMVHANGRIPVQQALEAGCHSIEHGYFMGEENLQRMAEKQAVLIPTLYAMKVCAEMADTPGERKMAEKNLAHQLEQVARARDFGVRVALGTDSGSLGVLHGEAVVEELKLLIKAGYSLAEAIQCATYNGAQLLGIDAGLIAVGRPAHFLVARGTPAQLPRKFSYLEAIYLAGKPSPFYKKNPSRANRQ